MRTMAATYVILFGVPLALSCSSALPGKADDGLAESAGRPGAGTKVVVDSALVPGPSNAPHAAGDIQGDAYADVLRLDVGTWDLTIESFNEEGELLATTKGVETNRLLGDRWLISDFSGELGGEHVDGHHVMGFDSTINKYVGSWVDSFSERINVGQYDYDPKTRTLSGWAEGPSPGTGRVKMRSITRWLDDGTRVMEVYPNYHTHQPFVRVTSVRREDGESAD